MNLLTISGFPTSRWQGISQNDVGRRGVLAYRTLKGKGRLADMLGADGAFRRPLDSIQVVSF